jgi:hypothetical protein
MQRFSDFGWLRYRDFSSSKEGDKSFVKVTSRQERLEKNIPAAGTKNLLAFPPTAS